MRKIFSINLFLSFCLLSLMLVFNFNLPNKFNVNNINDYQLNYLTNLNQLDFRHWGVLLFGNNKSNAESIYNAIYLASKQKKYRDISLYRYVQEYQNLNTSEKNKINKLIENGR